MNWKSNEYTYRIFFIYLLRATKVYDSRCPLPLRYFILVDAVALTLYMCLVLQLHTINSSIPIFVCVYLPCARQLIRWFVSNSLNVLRVRWFLVLRVSTTSRRTNNTISHVRKRKTKKTPCTIFPVRIYAVLNTMPIKCREFRH